jgi:hypothetical protein
MYALEDRDWYEIQSYETVAGCSRRAECPPDLTWTRRFHLDRSKERRTGGHQDRLGGALSSNGRTKRFDVSIAGMYLLSRLKT